MNSRSRRNASCLPSSPGAALQGALPEFNNVFKCSRSSRNALDRRRRHWLRNRITLNPGRGERRRTVVPCFHGPYGVTRGCPMGFRSGRGCWLGAALGAVGALFPLFSAPGMAAPGTAVGDTLAKIRIAFAGDSIVDNYWAGVERIIDGNACLKDAVELGRFAKNGTGLTRGDRTYWPREIKRVDAAFQPTLSVLSIGLNDQQFIVDGNGGRTAWGAPDWTDKYRHELDEFLKAAVETRAI